MEVKKSPKADLEDKRSMFVLIGFVLVFAVLYIGLEWSQKEKRKIEVVDEFTGIEEDMVQQTVQPDMPPPPPPPPTEVLAQIFDIVDNTVKTDDIKLANPEDDKLPLPPPPPPPPPPTEDIEEIFMRVDDPPSFPGGEKAMMEFLRTNIIYPTIAIENGLQGTVMVTFVVNRDGQIVDVEISRGIHESLDREALRVVRRMPAWKPGKQHGKPVRVRFSLPVRFNLGR